ncbi:MAG: efflux RND transporter periplasmic adaptor subunit [Planctomycetota bacterium]
MIWILVGLAVLAGLYFALQPRPVAVDVAEIVSGDVRAFVEEEGRTRVVKRFVVAAPVGGRLMRIDLEEGARVEKGQLLAEIDPLPLRGQVLETEAEIRAVRQRIAGVDVKKPKQEELDRAHKLEKVAEQQLDVARKQLDEAEALLRRAELEQDRVAKLVRAKAATEAELDQVNTIEAEAQARRDGRSEQVALQALRVEASVLNTKVLESRLKDYEWEKRAYEQQISGLDARLKVLLDNVARAKITAPATGVLLRLDQESQRWVQAGTPLVEIGNLGTLEVEADFLSEDVAHMKPGMEAEVFGRALGDTVVPAAVKRIYPAAFKKISSLGVEQQRVTVVLEPTAPLALGDRYRVEARVLLDQRQGVVLVPEGALFRRGDGWRAFVVRDGVAGLVDVETGLRDGRVREVLSGLKPGDVVVLHPDNTVEDGGRVEVIR